MTGRVLAALALLGIAACGSGEEPLDPGNGLNVLLISLDSTRRDLLGAYGGESPHAPGVATSPRLDALAEEGVLLEDAYATTSWTLPSHVSMLTGQPELVHTVDVDYQRFDEDRPFLPEMLQARGYRTAGFFSGPYLEPHFGFDRGYDRYEGCYGDSLTAASKRAAQLRRVYEEALEDGNRIAVRTAESELLAAEREVEDLSHRDVSTKNVTDAALAELEAAVEAGKPFFLFAHYFDPHYDYLPPVPFDHMFDPAYDGEGAWDDFLGNEAISTEDLASMGGRNRVISDRDLENVRALYAGELCWTDSQIGRLLDRLDELGVAERTLVVVVSDHGDEFFEHGSIGHRRTLYEEVMQVPMILRLPGALPAGKRVEGLVSVANLVPTILDVLEITPREESISSSFLPLIRGEDDGAERGILGRIVRFWSVRIQIPVVGGERIPVDGRRIQVIETWRQGPIKVTRERAWVRADDSSPERLTEAVAHFYGEGSTVDVLRWIDLERFPDEREEDHSTDFTDLRAREALREFHDRYRELLAVRGRAASVETDAELMSLLNGLGYTDGGDDGTAPLEHETFLFPPPGRDLLREDR